MTIQLIGATRRIAPGTELLYEYTAEEDITENEVVAKSETTRRVLKAQATTWSRMPAIGVARQSRKAGKTIKVEQFGVAQDIARDADFNYDDEIFVSTTAGKATSTPPEGTGKIVQSLGRAINSSEVVLHIQESIEIGA